MFEGGLREIKKDDNGEILSFSNNFENCVSIIRDCRHPRASEANELIEEVTLNDLKSHNGKVSALRKVVLDIDVSQCIPNSPEFKFNNVDLNTIMCGYILPPNLSWPFFYSQKQEFSSARNLLFCRLSRTHPALYREAIRVANRESGMAVIIGVSVSKTYIRNIRFISSKCRVTYL